MRLLFKVFHKLELKFYIEPAAKTPVVVFLLVYPGCQLTTKGVRRTIIEFTGLIVLNQRQ